MNNCSKIIFAFLLSPCLGYCSQGPQKDVPMVHAFCSPQLPVHTDKPLNSEFNKCVSGYRSSCDAVEGFLKEIQTQELAEVARIKATTAKMADCLPRPCVTGCCIRESFDVQESVSRLLPRKDHPCHYPLYKALQLTNGPYFFGNDGTGSYIIGGYVPDNCFAFVSQWINKKLEKAVARKHKTLFATLAVGRERCDRLNEKK